MKVRDLMDSMMFTLQGLDDVKYLMLFLLVYLARDCPAVFPRLSVPYTLQGASVDQQR